MRKTGRSRAVPPGFFVDFSAGLGYNKVILYAICANAAQKGGGGMDGKKDGQRWIAPAAMVVLSLVIAFASFSGINTGALTVPVLLACLLLPVICAVTGALYGWPVTAASCLLAATAGWRIFPAEALPAVLAWCLGSGLTACLPMKKRLLRPALRAGMCFAVWGIGFFILQRLTGGQIITGLAQAACGYADASSDSTQILLQAYSAGYARLQGADAVFVQYVAPLAVEPDKVDPAPVGE